MKYEMLFKPRSYVTAGFDIITEPLIRYVCKIFSTKRTDWWIHYILYNEERVFDKDYNIKLPPKGNPKTLGKYFDEYHLFKLITLCCKKVFDVEFIVLCEELQNIRNNWAHRNENTYEWAEESLNKMVDLLQYINSSEALERLYQVMKDMRIVNPSCSRDKLYQFIEKEVLEINENSSSINDEIKRITNDTRNILRTKKTASEVAYFFWRAIFEDGGSYDAIKNLREESDLRTFEDVRAKFEELCEEEG